MNAATLSYCGEEVRRHDHDRFMTCLFAPSQARDHLFALYAFNLEVAKTAEVVSESMLGRIRLQWWRESLDGIYGGNPRHHAVVEALTGTVKAHHLPRALFDTIIDGRELDLEDEPPRDLAAFETYAASTSGALAQIAAMILGAKDAASLKSADHVGTAWAMTGLLRAVPFHAARRRLFLPQELTARHNLEQRELFELRSSDALKEITREIAARARWHLAEARQANAGFSRSSLPAVLCATIARRHLKSLERAGWDPLDPVVLNRRHGLAWRLSLAWLMKRT
jgi:phytoene synthase